MLGPLLALALGVGLWLVRRRIRLPAPVARKGLAGVVLFLVATIGIEMLGNFTPTGLARALQITLEEGGEMIAVTLVLWATLELLADLLGRQPVTVSRSPGS